MINYTPKTSIELAINTEKKGAKFYSKLADKFSNDSVVKEVFLQLANDEGDHERQFCKILETMPDEGKIIHDENQIALLQVTSAPEFFKPEALNVDQGLTREDALLNALEFEKSSLLHYMTLNEILNNEWLKAIIYTEKSHVRALIKTIISGAKFRSLSDTWA